MWRCIFWAPRVDGVGVLRTWQEASLLTTPSTVYHKQAAAAEATANCQTESHPLLKRRIKDYSEQQFAERFALQYFIQSSARWKFGPYVDAGQTHESWQSEHYLQSDFLFRANQWESHHLLSQSVSVAKVAWSNIWPLGFSHILEGIIEVFCRTVATHW